MSETQGRTPKSFSDLLAGKNIPDLDNRPEVHELFSKLKADLSALERLLEKSCSHWEYEDSVYRLYHQSFKVYGLQTSTLAIVEKLRALAPERELNQWFMQIVRDGTGRAFTTEDNLNWLEATRPILEAFFHARFFSEMAVKYSRELQDPPLMLPSGWAAFLYLYNLR
jgi:hypothetical protein